MGDQEKARGAWTWERTIEILKIAATVYVGLVGTVLTWQYNERQQELARIEAIAKMLPNLAEEESKIARSGRGGHSNGGDAQSVGRWPAAAGAGHDSTGESEKPGSQARMIRDGAMWAIFRTSDKNKTMLRDLAALFPEDIYRVVSAICVADNLTADDDAITALQVSSEKLANRYSNSNANLSARLYAQALRLEKKSLGHDVPLYIVDIADVQPSESQSEEDRAQMLTSINDLADLHRDEADQSQSFNTDHWQAKQLYMKVQELGDKHESSDVQLQVARADLGLAHLYKKEKRYAPAISMAKQAETIRQKVLGQDHKLVTEAHSRVIELEKLAQDQKG